MAADPVTKNKMSATGFETDAVQETAHPFLIAISSVGMLLLVAGPFLKSGIADAAGFVLMMSIFLTKYFPRRCAIRMLVDDVGVFVNGKLALPRTHLLGAAIREIPSRESCVMLASRSWQRRSLRVAPTFEFILPNQQRARELVRALSLPESASFYRAKTMTVHWWHTMVLSIPVGIWTTWAPHVSGWVVIPLAIAAYVAFVFTIMQIRITVGNDGVHLQTLIRARFIPFTEIRSVNDVRQTLALTLHSGRQLQVKVLVPDLLVTIKAKIIKALEHRAIEGAPVDVQRKGRSVHDWLTALRSIASVSTSDYRQHATSAADLAGSLHDQAVAPSSRVASAVALRVLDPESATSQIRLLVSHTANPKLRVAFEKITDGSNDAELEECLQDLIAEEEKSSGRESRKE